MNWFRLTLMGIIFFNFTQFIYIFKVLLILND